MRKACLATLALLLTLAPQARALDDAHARRAEHAVDEAIEYLRRAQNEDGSWTPKPGPAITGLVVAGMLRHPDIDRDDPTVRKGLDYILAHQKPDGGFYDKHLKNYNTGLCLMALGRVGDDPEIRAKIEEAWDFFRKLQWTEGKTDPQGNPITRTHPYYGGAAYGDSSHGRPDGSNTNMMIAALYDSGFDCSRPLVQRAVAFLSRLQGASTNDLFADTIVNDGGMIYATSINKDHIGVPQTRTSDASYERIVEGEKEEYDRPLPTYGSMTYAGYMSFLYAQLDRKDPRVVAARSWISNNYAVDHHPRMGQASYYYYLYFMTRALRANGQERIGTPEGRWHDWANDVIDALADRQRDDPNLVTGYALNALQTALGR